MKKILIIDDHAIVRDGVKRIFEEQPGEVVFGEASTAWEALRIARDQDWDLAVLDLSLGERSGLEVLKELKQLRTGLPVLILSMHSEKQYARRAFQAGAAGYITKDSPRAELLKAIERVAEGGKYVSPALAEELVVDLERGNIGSDNFEGLTPRQFEVLQLIAEGKSTKQIALALNISVKTVETHRTQLADRLNIHDTAGLVRFAIKKGLIQLED